MSNDKSISIYLVRQADKLNREVALESIAVADMHESPVKLSLRKGVAVEVHPGSNLIQLTTMIRLYDENHKFEETINKLRDKIEGLGKTNDELREEVYNQAMTRPENILTRKFLLSTIDELDLNVRAYNFLLLANIRYIHELIFTTEDNLFRIKGCGRVTLTKIIEALDKFGFHIGAYPEEYPWFKPEKK